MLWALRVLPWINLRWLVVLLERESSRHRVIVRIAMLTLIEAPASHLVRLNLDSVST